MNFPADRPPDSTGQFEETARNRFLTLRETAAFLNVHPNTVRSQVRRGKIPGAKVGRGWRFLEADLIASIRSRYRTVPRAHPGIGGKEGLWRLDAVQEFILPGRRQATERALDALLERPGLPRDSNVRTI